jgi:carbonic anhydrase
MKQIIKRSLMAMLGLMVGLTAFVGVAIAEGPVHWGYEGEEGPEHWGELSPDFALCSTGTEQSPINIPTDAALNPADLGYNYLPSAVNIFNNGHTIQVNYDPGSDLVLNNQVYELLQFHFHAGSEHTRDGQQLPIEMHLVHRNADGGLAVVGAWVEIGSHNAAFEPVFNHLPATEGEPEAVPGETVNADELLPAERSYRQYNGSLTTPPCTQDVKWIMLSETVELSEAQITAYTDIFDHNFRPTQPFNERSFLLSSEVGAAPETLPESGGVAFPVASVLMGLGALGIITGTGLYLYRRKLMTQ